MKSFKIKTKNMLKRIYISMIRSQQRRALAHTLACLSNRELNDIGINRNDIPRIVAEAYAKK